MTIANHVLGIIAHVAGLTVAHFELGGQNCPNKTTLEALHITGIKIAQLQNLIVCTFGLKGFEIDDTLTVAAVVAEVKRLKKVSPEDSVCG